MTRATGAELANVAGIAAEKFCKKFQLSCGLLGGRTSDAGRFMLICPKRSIANSASKPRSKMGEHRDALCQLASGGAAGRPKQKLAIIHEVDRTFSFAFNIVCSHSERPALNRRTWLLW
jgi:hypothetical protein